MTQRVKKSACNAKDLGSIPGLGRSPEEGNGNPLQYSYWIIPWMEEPGGPQSMRLDATEGLTFSLSARDGLCVNALDGRKCPFYLGAVRL